MSAQLAVINRDNIHSLGELESKIEKLTAEYESARQEINKLSEKLSQFEAVEKQVGGYFDLLEKSELSETEQLQLKMYGSIAERCSIHSRDGLQRVENLRKDTSEKVDYLNEQMKKCKQLYDTYASIFDTYKKISEGDYISNLIAEKKREDGRDRNGGKLSTKTIKLYKSMISTICDYAVKMQMIQTNPCKNVTIPKVITPEKEYYSIEEAQHLLNLFKQEDEENYKYVLFYTLAIYTGFRLGELMGLEWKDVNFDTNVITVNHTCLYSKAKGGLYTETPKTSQSLRSLKVPQGVIDMLTKWKWLQNAQREKVSSKWIETDRIFTKWNGLTLDRSAPGYFFKQFCKRTGMRYVSNHSMRHLNASLLINAGVDVKTVQSCLGHSTPTTTLSVYLHTFQTAQAAAMEAVAEALPLTCSNDGKSA